jgi:hypothetical protein
MPRLIGRFRSKCRIAGCPKIRGDALAQSAELRPERLEPQLLLELDDRLERKLSAQAHETRRVAGTGIFGANRLVLSLLLRSRLPHGETVPSTELCSG